MRFPGYSEIEKQAAEFFPGAEDLPPPWTSPPRITSREIEQLKRAGESRIETRGVLRVMGSHRALDLTPNVAQLLCNRQ